MAETSLFEKRNMSSFDRSADFLLTDEESLRAVERAVKAAIETVLYVVSRISDSKMREYQIRVAEAEKENERLRAQGEAAVRELTDLRVRLRAPEPPPLSHPGHATGGGESEEVSVASPEDPREEDLRADRETADLCPSEEEEGGTVSGLFEKGTVREWIKEESTNVSEIPIRISKESCSSGPGESASTSASQASCPESARHLKPFPADWGRCYRLQEALIKEEPLDDDAACVKREGSERSDGSSEAESNSMFGSGEHLSDLGSPFAAPMLPGGTRNLGIRLFAYNGETPVQSFPSAHRRNGKLSSAERQRRYREKIRADPERGRAHREKDRQRYHERKKLISDLSEHCQRLKREAWREAARRYRQRKKSCSVPGPSCLQHRSSHTVEPAAGQRRGAFCPEISQIT
ncbi:uncharacterized protein [Lepisosteus oculatus]|uniref:uncharacterized protein n=1 Tax=Lepisosteus oculatus TaxID=7918 RepID=UPI003718AD85